MSEKFIQWQANTFFGMGVEDQIAGAALGLYPLGASGANLVWNIDLIKNVILLEAGGQTLAVDFKDGRVAAEVPIVLSVYNGAPTKSQQWSFTARKGYITSLANTSLVIDDKVRGTTPGNPLWAYPFNGSIAQQWKPQDPYAFLATGSIGFQ
ncbi:RICIN domain-containing protein [Collimonas humicola]|uniref:RICIN domain-containing protein n=1 Tax=Collimonas humicola TaxID=2825886 RepID=UPI001B8C03C0|nr:RICIN domain-containing protein [Collimonas humicola]